MNKNYLIKKKRKKKKSQLWRSVVFPQWECIVFRNPMVVKVDNVNLREYWIFQCGKLKSHNVVRSIGQQKFCRLLSLSVCCFQQNNCKSLILTSDGWIFFGEDWFWWLLNLCLEGSLGAVWVELRMRLGIPDIEWANVLGKFHGSRWMEGHVALRWCLV